MDLISAVNAILPALGENPVASISAKNPTVGVVLQALNHTRERLLGKGWWFNRTEVTLYRDSFNRFTLPAHTIEWQYSDVPSVQRGDMLVNPEDGFSFTFPKVKSIKGHVTLDVPFDDLPHSFKEWVVIRAKILAYQNDIGAGSILEEWERESYRLQSIVEMMNLRSKRTGTRRDPRYHRILRYVGR